MPIPWMLVWFGVLGFQDRATNLGFGMKKSGDNTLNLILENFFKKRDEEFEFNLIFILKNQII